MTDAISEAEKAVFQAAVERRKERGIRLKRIWLFADATQVAGFHVLWDTWVTRFGKQAAMDVLLELMADAEARWQDAQRAKQAKRKKP